MSVLTEKFCSRACIGTILHVFRSSQFDFSAVLNNLVCFLSFRRMEEYLV